LITKYKGGCVDKLVRSIGFSDAKFHFHRKMKLNLCLFTFKVRSEGNESVNSKMLIAIIVVDIIELQN
jgi:hypothetical protein